MRLLLISITAATLLFSGLIQAEVATKSFQQVLSRATLAQNHYAADNMLLVGHSAGGHLALLAAHEQFGLPVKGGLNSNEY